MMKFSKYLPLTLLIIACNSDSELEEIKPQLGSNISFSENFEVKLSTSTSSETLDETEAKLNNTSFEEYFEEWTIDKGSYIISIDEKESIEGENSLKIEAANTDTFYALPMIQTPSLKNIEPSSSYKFSFWLKGDLSDDEVSSLYYYFLGGGSNATIENIPNEWTQYEFTFTTGSDIDKLNLVFQPTLAKTTLENWNKPLDVDNMIWIDNVKIIKLDKTF